MLKCDLHIHSKYSFDSLADPEKIVDVAVARGLGCIAIADHGNIDGSIKASVYAQQNSLPILIIISQEVKSKSGDILALNIKEPIPEHLDAKVTIDLIHSRGGLAVAAHPFGLLCNFKGALENFVGRLDAVEILNASVFDGNDRAKQFANSHNLAFTAGSDAHFANRFIGKAYLELPLDYSPELTANDVIAAIKQKQGKVGGRAANFFSKALDHSCRTLAKSKALLKK
ncbi:MAG: PHP domain-containing protein [Candidatus Pacebacteria bacterium]|jgi:hypothetical protein|nr:PHP domain-containing protein [Candidatus Paceibacterota bacterium]